MKNKILSSIIVAAIASLLFYACKDSFLEQLPQGVYDQASLTNKKGIEGMLINAYATLDGPEGSWYAGASNWVWGSVLGGDAYKGSEPTDQVDVNPVNRYDIQPSNPIVLAKWDACYDGIGQANQVLKILPEVKDIDDKERLQIEAEARFLRAHHHFEAKKVFNNVPYVDENVTDYKSLTNIEGSGYTNIWPQIEADLQFAYDNLDAVRENVGRVNKWAAACYLAKAYMFQSKFSEAKALFDQIIANGVTSKGLKYGLADSYHANFRVLSENNEETIFSIQASYGDGSNTNGNYDNTLNYPHSPSTPGAGCCGFFQPSQNLVNSYRTDNTGLPLISTYNDESVTSDEALTSSDPFTPYQGAVDPRLDWSVGRRGIPYQDWGLHPGRNWIRDVDYGGPYSPKKNVFYQSDIGSTADAVGWGWNNVALNYTIMRFADVLLLAAEAEVEVGSLEKAREYVNIVRERAGHYAPSITPGGPSGEYAISPPSSPYANYVVGIYAATWTDKNKARDAVRFERKLELSMEGHRFFDLVRWGIAAEVINNEYLPKEKTRRVELLGGASFEKGKDEYLPIPDYAITQSIVNGQPMLKQNPGY